MNEAVTTWINRHATPLTEATPEAALTDLAALTDVVGDATIVGLGQTTRAGREIMVLGHRIVRFLVERLGFRALAIQDDESVIADLDHYVLTGKGDATATLKLAWRPWQNTNTVEVVEWIRRYNIEHPDDPVRLHGLNPAVARLSDYDAVIKSVAQVAPEHHSALLGHYAPIRTAHHMGEHVQKARGVHPGRPFVEHARLARDLVASLSGLDADVLAKADLIVEFHANGILGDHDFDGEASRVAARLSKLHHEGGRRIVYWEGIANTAAGPLWLNPFSTDIRNIGSRLRDELGSGYISVAMGFDRGEIHAGQRVPPPQGDFADARFGAAEPDTYLLHLHAPRPAEVNRWFAGRHKIRVVVGVYKPDDDADHYVLGEGLNRLFDAVVRTKTISPTTFIDATPDEVGQR